MCVHAHQHACLCMRRPVCVCARTSFASCLTKHFCRWGWVGVGGERGGGRNSLAASGGVWDSRVSASATRGQIWCVPKATYCQRKSKYMTKETYCQRKLAIANAVRRESRSDLSAPFPHLPARSLACTCAVLTQRGQKGTRRT